MANFTNIDGVYAKDTELRSGISDLRGDILSQTIKPLSITENGTYTSDPTAGTYGYSPVSVNVSSPIVWVRVTEDAQDNLVVDKTFTEMYTAYTNGKLLLATLNAPNQTGLTFNQIPQLQLETISEEYGEIDFIYTYMGDGVIYFTSIVIYDNGEVYINEDHVNCS